MTNKITPISVIVTFKGETYLAEILPTINGKPVALKPLMNDAEVMKKLYSTRLQEVLQYMEMSTDEGYGRLLEATSRGFKFENKSIDHAAAKTQDVWTQFVDALHNPAPFLAQKDDELEMNEVGSEMQIKLIQNSYLNLPNNEKKTVHAETLLKVIRNRYGLNEEFTQQEQDYLEVLRRKPRIAFDLYSLIGKKRGDLLTEQEKEYLGIFIGRTSRKEDIDILWLNILNPDNEAEKFTEKELSNFFAEYRAIKKVPQ